MNSLDIIKYKYPVLIKQLERLKGITGFVSIVGDDKRVAIFNRYDHIARVNRLLHWYIADLEDIDKEKCAFLGLFHDINRLPFSHNFEKYIQYSQGAYLPYYMSIFNVKIENDYYDDFNAFYQRELNFSVESRIVCLIDVVENFIEDFLFMFSSLWLQYEEIPTEILSVLGFEDTKRLDFTVKKLNGFYLNDITHFTTVFNDMVFDYARRFIGRHKKDSLLIFSNSDFLDFGTTIKKQLAEKIYPINNELVSKGKMIAEEVGIPYMNYLEKERSNPFEVLFMQTDNDLLESAVSAKIIQGKDVGKYYPNLSPF